MFDYLKDPAAIYQLSFERVRKVTNLAAIPASLTDVAVRIVHSSATPEIINDLAWHHDPVAAARHALSNGAKVLVDSEMVAKGISRRLLPMHNAVMCSLNDPRISSRQAALQTTRSAAAVDLWREHLTGSVIVIGNAPTALFRLLEILIEEKLTPAALFAFPVGFVGASESKEALINSNLDVPYVTLRGRRGGSAIAAAALNAINSDSPS